MDTNPRRKELIPMIKEWLSSFLLLLLFISETFLVTAQPSDKISRIHFLPFFGEEKLILHQKFALNHRDSIELNTFRFYVSDIFGLEKKEKLIYHLVDISDTASLKFQMKIPDKEVRLNFFLGIDSATNEMGIGEGDLDPTRGMYWTWQSGYINVKLEGTLIDSIGNKTNFTFHLGGFRSPYLASQFIPLNIPTPAISQDVKIKIELKDFFQIVDARMTNKIMSPSMQAVEISKKLAGLFSLME